MPEEKRRRPEETRMYVETVLNLLEKRLRAYKDGETEEWLAISNLLFILLCDTSKASPVAKRVIPELSLHPLRQNASNERRKYLLYVPAIEFDEDSMWLDLFDQERPRIPLAKWLGQVVVVLAPKGEITLEGIIRKVRHQEGGGHYDPEVGDTVYATTAFKLQERGKPEPFHVKCLIAIAEYVVGQIRRQLPP